MKQVVSVSLGSSKRDHQVEVELLGEKFSVGRKGTDGDIDGAITVLRELDGKVDAIGLGGVDLYLSDGVTKYVIQDALRLRQAVKETPVVDGSGLKNTLEREVVKYLYNESGLLRPGQKVLMVCGTDRFGMAETLAREVGCNTIFGDLMFTMGMSYPIQSIEELQELARKLLPEMSKMPIATLYPTGKKQDESSDKVAKFRAYFDGAEVIAGDFHFIRRFAPPELPDKLILTNSTTSEDVEWLRRRGVRYLVTTTPDLNGRTFGTNVIEAMFLVLLGKRWEEIIPDDYLGLIKRLNLKPTIKELY